MSEQDNLWNDKEKAQEVFKKKRKLESLLSNFNSLKTEYDDLINFYELFKSENDENLRQEFSNLLKNTIKLSKELNFHTSLNEIFEESISLRFFFDFNILRAFLSKPLATITSRKILFSINASF